MIVTKITNHVQAALDRFIEQYKGRVLLAGLMTSLVQQIQDLENAVYPLDQYRQLLFAYGQQLDNLGEIIGLERNGLPDDEYLVLLLGTIAENNSDTTAPVMLYIVQTVFQATSVFIKDPNSNTGAAGPAQVAFGIGSPTFPESLYPIIETLIANSVGAGIAITYLSSFDASGCFAMAGPQAWTRQLPPSFTPSPSQPWPFGFGDLNNPNVGGGYASLLFDDNGFELTNDTFITTENYDTLTTEDGDRLIT